MRPTTIAALVLGLCTATGSTNASEVGPDGFDELTEWKVPFTDANPFQIAVAGADVVYLRDNADQHLGRLEVDRGRFTEWPLPYAVTSPGEIKVRTSDGSVFIAGLSHNEIGQFDLQTQSLRRWPLPLDINFGGPFNLGLDELGGVFFTAYNSTGALIGRLDTMSGTVTTWKVPDAIGDATRLTVAPRGTVFFNDNALPFALASLNVGTGTFVAWGLTTQPAFAIVSDSSGNVFFQEQSSSFVGIARLSPASGRLTEWGAPGSFNEDMTMTGGRVFMGGSNTKNSVPGLAALDPNQPGIDSVITSSVVEGAAPTTVGIASTATVLRGQRARGQVTSRLVRRRHLGAFVAWPIPEQPRMVAAGVNCVFFGSTSQVQPVIGRLTR